MIRSIFSNYIGMLVSGVVAFLVTPILIRSLGDFHYGMWVLVASVLDYYGLLDIGIRTTLQRYVARCHGGDQRDSLNRTLMTAMVISIAVAILIGVLTSAFAGVLPGLFHVTRADRTLFAQVLFLLGFSVAVTFPARVLGAYLCGLQRFDVYNLAGAGTSIVRAGLLVMVVRSGRGIHGCAAVELVVAVLSLVVHWILVHWIDPEINFDLRKARWSEFRELLSFSFFVFISQVADLFRFRLDSLVVARWLNVALVTPFNVAARLVDYFRYVTAGIRGPLMTELSSMEGQGREQELNDLFLRTTRVTALTSLFLGSFLCLNGKMLLALWVGKRYVLSSYPTLAALAIGRVAATVQAPSVMLLLAKGKNRPLAFWSLAEGLINLALSIYWAGKYGILGVALGTAIPMLAFKLFLLPWYTLYVSKISVREYVTAAVGRPLLALLGFLAIIRLGTFIPDDFSPLSLLTSIVWQGSVYGLLTYAIGFTAAERQNIWKRAKELLGARSLVPTVEETIPTSQA
jgi:O-antigen/teichoic acid export membrane protein